MGKKQRKETYNKKYLYKYRFYINLVAGSYILNMILKVFSFIPEVFILHSLQLKSVQIRTVLTYGALSSCHLRESLLSPIHKTLNNLPTPLAGGQEKSFAEQMRFLGIRSGGHSASE